ncbi:hypothetical protein QJS04_geneDACA007116 [Acorus gramineus]|uniref:Uncharacterized protein n=1 Tax=Acorus gramineus TaxID=55184 RepID=A0AAV9BRG8_ACOGR|nr:hypothetical protein QJS04_geneDACA007116 [Acorus gramineus]
MRRHVRGKTCTRACLAWTNRSRYSNQPHPTTYNSLSFSLSFFVVKSISPLTSFFGKTNLYLSTYLFIHSFHPKPYIILICNPQLSNPPLLLLSIILSLSLSKTAHLV